MGTVDFNSPYYPYEKVHSGFNTLKGAENIPHDIIMYLLDLPDKNGYVPVDDNGRPRVRLIKYLWYDESNPLGKALPTPKEKLSLLYNGENSAISPNNDEDAKNHPKGYRIFGQQYEEPSQLNAKVMLRVCMARAIARNDLKTVLGIVFNITVNYALDNVIRTNVYSRMYAMHQCIVEALHGVNITGIGTIHYNKSVHGDCGYTLYHDEGTNIYSDTFMAIDWEETSDNNIVVPY